MEDPIWLALKRRYDDRLLAELPREMWSECAEGRALIELARVGKCKMTRINATLCRFEPLPNGERDAR